MDGVPSPRFTIDSRPPRPKLASVFSRIRERSAIVLDSLRRQARLRNESGKELSRRWIRPFNRTECGMKRSCFFLLAANLCISALVADLNGSMAGSSEIDLTQWTPPDNTAVGDEPFGTLVKYGYALFTDTADEIGAAPSSTRSGSRPAGCSASRHSLQRC
jgi:hypothetical protein